MTTPGMPTGPGPVQVSSKPTGAGTPVTEKVFGLLLTALGVQMAFKGGRRECDSPDYGPLTTWGLGRRAGIVGFAHSGR